MRTVLFNLWFLSSFPFLTFPFLHLHSSNISLDIMPRSERQRANFRDYQLYPAYMRFLSLSEHDAGLVLANAALTKRTRHSLLVARQVRRISQTTAAALRNIEKLHRQLQDADRCIQGFQQDMFIDIEYSKISPAQMAIPAFAVSSPSPPTPPPKDSQVPWRGFAVPRTPPPRARSPTITRDNIYRPVPRHPVSPQLLYPDDPEPQYATKSIPFPDTFRTSPVLYHDKPSGSRLPSTPHPDHGILTTTELFDSLVEGQHVERAAYHTNQRAANALREMGDEGHRRFEARRTGDGQDQGHA